MAVAIQHQSDVEAILAKRYDNGWDYWTTPTSVWLREALFPPS